MPGSDYPAVEECSVEELLEASEDETPKLLTGDEDTFLSALDYHDDVVFPERLRKALDESPNVAGTILSVIMDKLGGAMVERTAEEVRGVAERLREDKMVERKPAVALLRRAAFELETACSTLRMNRDHIAGMDASLREASRRLVRCAEMRQQAEAKCEEFRKEALASRQHPRGLYVKLFAMHYATALQAWGAKVGKGLTAEQATAQAAKLAHSMTVLALRNAC